MGPAGSPRPRASGLHPAGGFRPVVRQHAGKSVRLPPHEHHSYGGHLRQRRYGDDRPARHARKVPLDGRGFSGKSAGARAAQNHSENRTGTRPLLSGIFKPAADVRGCRRVGRRMDGRLFSPGHAGGARIHEQLVPGAPALAGCFHPQRSIAPRTARERRALSRRFAGARPPAGLPAGGFPCFGAVRDRIAPALRFRAGARFRQQFQRAVRLHAVLKRERLSAGSRPPARGLLPAEYAAFRRTEGGSSGGGA